MVKILPDNIGDIREVGSTPKLGRSPEWQLTPVLLAEESHGQKSLVVQSIAKN